MLFLASFLGEVEQVGAKSYQISQVNIEAVAEKIGAMQVSEKRTYDFDGDYTFAYREILKTASGRSAPYKIDELSVCEIGGCYRQLSATEIATADDIRPAGTFYVKDQGNKYYIKWFYRSSTQKIFDFKYRIENAVTKQRDTDEIYWQFIGTAWEIDQGKVTARLIIPWGIEGMGIKAWGHGPINGVVNIPNNKEVIWKSSRVKAGERFEGRVIVPLGTFSGGETGNKSKADIEKEENKYIEETVTKVSNLQKIGKGLSIAVGIVLLWGIWKFIKQIQIFFKYHKDGKLPQVNLSGRIWEPPSEIDPAQVEQLLTGKKELTPKAFVASILGLINRGFYKIERGTEKERFIFKKYPYYLVTVANKNTPSGIEEKIINFLNRLPDLGGKIKMSEIPKWCQKHQETSYNFFKSLREITLKENLNEGYFDAESHKQKGRWNWDKIGPILAFIGVGIFGFAAGPATLSPLLMGIGTLGILFLVFYMVMLSLIQKFGEKRTAKGAEEAAKWLAFKKHLKEYNQTVKSPIDSVILWEKYLVYGTVLGISMKVLSELPVKFNQQEAIVVGNHWGGMHTQGSFSSSFSRNFGSIGRSINTSFSRSYSRSFGASGVGGGGGFSGGGGGGGAG